MKKAIVPTWMMSDYDVHQPSPELIKITTGTRLSKSAMWRILDKWSADMAVTKIKGNPYCLIDLIYGVGFQIADNIAVNVGVDRNSELRVQAGINHILNTQVQMMGHTCLPLEQLLFECKRLLGIKEDVIMGNIDQLLEDDEIVSVNDLIVSEKFYRQELFIANKLKDVLNNGKPKIEVKPISMRDLQDDQLQVVSDIVKSNVFILTGAPGTGKTYTIKKIISMYPDARLALCAPTGKAAKRIYEQTGMRALTIHKLLEPYMNKATGKFEFSKNAHNQLDYDIIVMDETSMVAVPLFNSLLKAVDINTKLIFIGDIYQLPPVGAGYVLRDMIHSRVIPSVELDIIKRQDAGYIIQNCHRIKNGKNILIDSTVKDKDFYFFQETNVIHIQEKIVKFLTGTLKKRYPDIDMLKDVQVITPLREKTDLSCLALNTLLQDKLNPSPVIGKYDFKVNDKVIQTKNNYQLDIINGDIGYIESINMQSKKLIVNFENPDRKVELPVYGNQLQLAYAITCHKFQGSENKIILIPIHRSFGSLIMQRNWIYTAVSRASKICIIIGDQWEFGRIIDRNYQIERFTNLRQFLEVNDVKSRQDSAT